MGLLLYGWNDMVDYDADRLNPRQRHLSVWRARHTGATARLPLRIVLVQLPFMVACAVLAARGFWCASRA